jgi:kynurenine formamidase
LEVDAVDFLKEKGIECLAMNSPSFDDEHAKSLANHHSLFKNSNNLIIENIDSN